MINHFKKFTIGIRKKNSEFKYFKPPFYEFWADPFIVENKDDLFIFYEVFNYFTNRGHISYIIYNKNKNKIAKKSILLKEKFHISYPQIVKYKEKYYMIPETYQNGTVNLYEFIEFPNKVKLKSILLNNIITVDSTMFINKNEFYLFTNPRYEDRIDDEEHLDIYYSSKITGPFQKIMNKNIEKYDKSNLRMAGNILEDDDKLYRISQNCENIYGEHMNVNEVTVLSKNIYHEKHLGKLELNINDYHHTFNRSKNYEVVDIVKYTSINFVLFTLIYRFPILFAKKILRIFKKTKSQ